ncbi:unnamed protein product [Echinostoma caproni]|uniref:Early growth response protein 1 n=1 Tax=Echinostoma caproni TaxID=27848 RepID=A0A183A793_9TREM|nr:unnamed protein product [Echinostoma caproni]
MACVLCDANGEAPNTLHENYSGHCTAPGALSYCHPDPCYQSTDVPTSVMITSCSSSTISTDSAKSMTCLEVNTRHSYPGFSDDYLLGSEAACSAPSTDSSLSPPQSFGSNSDNTVLEVKPPFTQPVSTYDYLIAPGTTGISTFKMEDDSAVVYQLPPATFIPEQTHTRAPPSRPQTLDIVYKIEPPDYVYDQTDPVTLKSSGLTLTTQENLFYPPSHPKQTRPRVVSAAVPSTSKPATKQNRVLEKAFACTMFDCTKRFARIDELKRHQRIHSDVKQFVCESCNKGFTRSDHLMTHRRTHTGERPYPCFHCERRFARSDERNRHSKVHFREKSKCGRKPKVVPAQQAVNPIVAESVKIPWTTAFQELSL